MYMGEIEICPDLLGWMMTPTCKMLVVGARKQA
jgi:hypothetical protein